MNCALILGSAPSALIPPPGSYDEVFCANGAGYSIRNQPSARIDNLVLSPNLTALESERETLTFKQLAGLQCDTVWYHGRSWQANLMDIRNSHSLWKGCLRYTYWHARHQIRRSGLEYRELRLLPRRRTRHDIHRYCDHDSRLLHQWRVRRPSTGLIALFLAVQRGHERIIVAGFDFGWRHAYMDSRQLDRYGSEQHRHAATDILLLRILQERHGGLVTTSAPVYEHCGIPMLDVG